MKTLSLPSRAAIALAVALLAPPAGAAPPAAPAPGPAEAVEREIESLLRELEAIRAELDRLGEVAEVPRATGIRIEILKDGDVGIPSSARLVVEGRTEDERGWTRAEREAFAAGSSPLAIQLPFLPGSRPARIELLSPAWKEPAAADFQLAVRAGETAVLRFRLHAARGAAALAPAGPK